MRHALTSKRCAAIMQAGGPPHCWRPLPQPLCQEILAALRTVRAVQQNPVSGAQVLGAHIEGPYLSMAKRGCHLKEFVRNPEKSEWEQLLEFEKEIKHITLAPEIPGALELMRDWSRTWNQHFWRSHGFDLQRDDESGGCRYGARHPHVLRHVYGRTTPSTAS